MQTQAIERPGDIVVSYSEIDAYRQCPHKHALAFRDRWSPPRVGGALARGLEWHKLMEVHYGCIKDGSSDRARMRLVAERLMAYPDEDVAGLLGWMYDGYVERWGTDKHWDILAIEEAHLARLPDSTGAPSKFLLRMRIDMMVRDRSLIKPRLVMVDHKTGKNLPKSKELDFDDQFGLYTFGKRQEGDPVFSVIYSSARTQRNIAPMALDDRFDRIPIYRTDKELDVIAREAWRTMATAYGITAENAPRSPDNERCRWRCPFTDPCLAGRKGIPEEKFLRAAGFKKLSAEQHWRNRGYALASSGEEHSPDG